MKIRQRSILFLTILTVITGCKSGTDNNNEPEVSNEIEVIGDSVQDDADNIIDSGEDLKLQLRTFDNTTGIVRLHLDDQNDYGCKIYLLNDDGTNWMELNSKSDYKAENPDFSPWAFDPDYDLLLFRCINEIKDGYTVIVNEKQNLRKLLKKSNCMKFEPWDEHILTGFIEFDRKSNPVRKAPENNAEIITPVFLAGSPKIDFEEL